MRLIGFSTGALSNATLIDAIGVLKNAGIQAIELSALRAHELPELVSAIKTMDRQAFDYISVHAPSHLDGLSEEGLAKTLEDNVPKDWQIIIHPDIVSNPVVWVGFGSQVAIENSDKRKTIGKTAAELRPIFGQLPAARLCFDIGHSHQVDPTMIEAYVILREFGDRVSEIHLSGVSSSSRHGSLSNSAISVIPETAKLVAPDVPVILESPVRVEDLQLELERARQALAISDKFIDEVNRLLNLNFVDQAVIMAINHVEVVLKDLTATPPRGRLAKRIADSFGSYGSFRSAFQDWIRIRNNLVHSGSSVSDTLAKRIRDDITEVLSQVVGVRAAGDQSGKKTPAS